MQRLLTEKHDKLLRQERALLEELRVHLTRINASEEDLALLKQSRQQLEELFLLVVVGEFNAGKTAFLNALLGDTLLREGVTPTTDRIHLLRYGNNTQEIASPEQMIAAGVPTEDATPDDILVLQLPVDWLQEINLVDTPGTNAVIQRHQEITEHFVPRSDLVLFVTSADRPFSESERTFLERVRQWGKKIVLVVNKIDLIPEPADRDQILSFVRENASELLGVEPEIFPISAKLALQAKLAGVRNNQGTWQASNFDALETYMLEHLNTNERLRLKLENPVGVAERLVEKYDQVIDERKTLLRDDFQTLDTIDEQLDGYRVDMQRDFKYHSSYVDNVLYEMAERGDKFFDDHLRVTRFLELLNSEKLRGDFEREVVSDTSNQIERHVNGLIDWLIEKDYQQWQDVMDYLNRRATQHADRIVGQVQSDFEFNRQNLLTSIGREAQTVVEGYDRETESLKLAKDVQSAIIQTAALEAGAIGLGAVLVALLTTPLLDFTGVLGAGAVAVLGLYVLPYRRGQIKTELRKRITDLRDQLNSVMEGQFTTQLNHSIQRIREAIAPYTRFVRIEREKLETLKSELQSTQGQLTDLRRQIRELES